MRFFNLSLIVLTVFVVAACNSTTPPIYIPTVAAVEPTALPPTIAVVPTVVAAAPTALPPLATETLALPTDAPTPTDTMTAVPTDVPPDTATEAAPPTVTLTFTPVPPTATKVAPAPTRKPTVVPPTAAPKPSANAFTVNWKSGFEYLPRDATSSWCQMHDEFQNLTDKEMPFQQYDDDAKKLTHLLTLNPEGTVGGYQPIVGIANADGSINHWQSAGWYAKAFGWRNGIEKMPPDGLAAGAPSGDWTWYGVTDQGQFCRFVYMKWDGQTTAAEYAPDGKLTDGNATLPPGAP